MIVALWNGLESGWVTAGIIVAGTILCIISAVIASQQ